MKSPYFQLLILLVLLVTVSPLKAQQGIAINTSGNSNYTGAILDLSNQNTIGMAGFLPPYVYLDSATVIIRPITGDTAANLSGLLVYNTNSSVTATNGLSGAGLYYWNNTLSTPSWVYMNTGGTILAANNGLSLSTNGDTVQLGGNNLIKTTKIPQNGDTLLIEGSKDTTIFNPIGQAGIGNTSPNSSAILDLSNTTHLGLLLPGMSTANLPAVQKGLMVFNTTTGCPEIDSGAVWYPVGSTRHGSVTFNYSFYWVVPACITSITVVAKGGEGGTAETYTGGKGAVITAAFTVTSGEVLGVYCGQKGTCPACYFDVNYDGGGGGGGSFVWDASTNTLLIAAGGGGGGGHSSNGASGSTSTTPIVSTGGDGDGNVASGGSGGYQGTIASDGGAGGGGGGWSSNATPAAETGTEGAGGKDFANSFTAGRGATSGNQPNCFGGYGGGGGGGYNTNTDHGGGGGGGGYNGGGGGDASSNTKQYGGGGGGSYVSGSTLSTARTNTGNGSITITW